MSLAFTYMGDDRITDRAPRGQHIGLRCKHHHDAKYSTKNIGFIGARSVFHSDGPDCDCAGPNSLEVEPMYRDLPVVVET